MLLKRKDRQDWADSEDREGRADIDDRNDRDDGEDREDRDVVWARISNFRILDFE